MVSRRHGQWKCGSYPRLPEGLTPHSQTDDKRRPGSPCYTTASTAVQHITSAAGGGQEGSSRGTVGAAALLPYVHAAQHFHMYMRHAFIASGRPDYTGIYYSGGGGGIHLQSIKIAKPRNPQRISFWETATGAEADHNVKLLWKKNVQNNWIGSFLHLSCVISVKLPRFVLDPWIYVQIQNQGVVSNSKDLNMNISADLPPRLRVESHKALIERISP